MPTEDAVRCFDPADGSERWRHPPERIGLGIALVDDMLYTTADGTVRSYRSVPN